MAASCVAGNTTEDCMTKIKDGQADLVTLGGGDIYKAGRLIKISRANKLTIASFFFSLDLGSRLLETTLYETTSCLCFS